MLVAGYGFVRVVSKRHKRVKLYHYRYNKWVNLFLRLLDERKYTIY